MNRLTYANVVATIALIFAVAGGTTAIAVSKSASKGDVNKKGNIRAGRVTTPKLATGAVTADKLAGIDVVQATGAGSAQANCQGAEQLIGGGGQLVGGAGAALATSAPLSNGWQAGVNAGVGNPTVIAYALCAKS